MWAHRRQSVPVQITLAVAFVAAAGGAACDGGKLSADAAGGDAAGGDAAVATVDAGAAACESYAGTVSWALTTGVTQLTGTVTGKVSLGNGAERITIVNATGAEHHLDLNIKLPAPLASGDQVEIKTAEYRAFQIYRTLQILKDGAPVLYVTQIPQSALPPPLTLEVGDSSCEPCLTSICITTHRLRASDEGGQPVIIDVGQQAQVGRFRVFNDRILRFPPGSLDVIDTLQVAVVRSP